MRSKLLNETGRQRTFALIFQTGDEAMKCLQDFVKKEGIAAALFTGIGAFSDAKLNYFDWEKKEYQPIPVRVQVEVASLTGDVALSPKGEPTLHIVLGRRDGGAFVGAFVGSACAADAGDCPDRTTVLSAKGAGCRKWAGLDQAVTG